jgi:polyribonucleotide nucleotidyltransferase
MIPPDRIGALIGPGGKNIKKLQEEYKVTIEITEEGMVKVLGPDTEILKTCIATINLQINGPEIGSIYEARVDSIKEYGAFVEIGAGVSGLVHVSELTDERVQRVEEFLTEGEVIKVKVMEIDKMGRIKLSAKAVQSLKRKETK